MNTVVESYTVKFAKGTKPSAGAEDNSANTTAGNEIVSLEFPLKSNKQSQQNNDQSNNRPGNQWGNQPGNQFQQGWGNHYGNQGYNPFSNGCQPMFRNQFQQPQIFNNQFQSAYGQWNYNNNNDAMNYQQMMKMQGKENQLVKPSTSYRKHKEEYVAILMDNLKSGKEIDPGQTATLTALGNIFSARSTINTTSSNKDAWYQSNKKLRHGWVLTQTI